MDRVGLSKIVGKVGVKLHLRKIWISFGLHFDLRVFCPMWGVNPTSVKSPPSAFSVKFL